jgi:hypothetical protein
MPLVPTIIQNITVRPLYRDGSSNNPVAYVILPVASPRSTTGETTQKSKTAARSTPALPTRYSQLPQLLAGKKNSERILQTNSGLRTPTHHNETNGACCRPSHVTHLLALLPSSTLTNLNARAALAMQLIPALTCHWHWRHLALARSRDMHHTSLITLDSSHITHHTSHVTHHTSHVTHHTSHVTCPPALKEQQPNRVRAPTDMTTKHALQRDHTARRTGQRVKGFGF